MAGLHLLKPIQSVFGEQGELIEAGLRRWHGLERETIYAVNTNELELREETLFFCLLGKGGQRRQAVTKIFSERIEPYVTLLNQFDRSFLFMSQTSQLQQLDPETLEDLKDLRDTREEGREIGLEQGREIGLEQGREIGLEQGPTLAPAWSPPRTSRRDAFSPARPRPSPRQTLTCLTPHTQHPFSHIPAPSAPQEAQPSFFIVEDALHPALATLSPIQPELSAKKKTP